MTYTLQKTKINYIEFSSSYNIIGIKNVPNIKYNSKTHLP